MLQQILIISKNASNKSCAELNFLEKTQRTRISVYHRSGARGFKDLGFWNITMPWKEELHFKAERCNKYRLYRKILEIKSVQNYISLKKLIGRASLSSSEVELGAPKIYVFENITTHWYEKVHFMTTHCKKYPLYQKMLQTKVM